MSVARIAIDTEHELIERGCVAPRLACLTLAEPEKPTKIFGRAIAVPMLRSYQDNLIIGHNVAHDFGVLCTHDEALIPLVFQLYAEGKVRDTGVREQLLLIREGRAIDGKGAKLGELAEKYLGVPLDKGADSWRYWYGDLMHRPVETWPAESREYAMSDARATLNVFDAQQGHSQVSSFESDEAESVVSPDESLQTRAAWVLHLMRMWGFRTDAAMVAHLKENLVRECAEAEARLLKFGLYKIAGTKKSPKLSKDMKVIKERIEAAFGAMGRVAPRTEPSSSAPEGNISTAADTLRETGDAVLIELADAAFNQKLLNTFVPLVEQGAQWPINPRWNVLVRSGRTSCGASDDPGNWQNPNKKGGIRECVIPRPGRSFGGADYGQLELCTLAQVLWSWFGHSEMAKAIRAGRDLHLELACSTSLLLGHLSYEAAKKLLKEGNEEVEAKRQFAKIANFGYPGGLGAESFISYADGMGAKWPAGASKLETSKALKNAWLNRWPEMRTYFQRITEISNTGRPFKQLFSERERGAPEFCSTANSFFQGLAADGAKEAMWQIAWECYIDTTSPLYGARIVLFLHDEFIIEAELNRAAAATDRLAAVMISAMQKWTPDVPIKAEPRLMDRWYKKAKEVRDAAGVLQIWTPPAMKVAA